jgi:hypothetical protein
MAAGSNPARGPSVSTAQKPIYLLHVRVVPSACHPDRGFSALLGDLALGHVALSWLELVVGTVNRQVKPDLWSCRESNPSQKTA